MPINKQAFKRNKILDWCSAGLDKAVDMLIKNGADASVTDQYGDTALILAIEKSN